MKRALSILGGIALLAVAVFLLAIVGWLIAGEVWPAVQNGSLNIESSSRILNILWEGNELYILLTAYTFVAGGLTYAAVWSIRSGWQRRQR